ncbi:MaoC family dehydratase [Arthrobacter roseus]|uniref:MaoC family dehydratase n=1 Tax=Arthrobacter roseus TaxID=136274 RepID=UPI001963A87A|nr:MaoC/PaaZ C-terminal domain-containing protein [Arthrobacter roseus]MBM7848535.1 acyl dehydratase [Arthrobacter roseus]
MKTIDLSEIPALPKLYVSAVGAAARQKLGGKQSGSVLPEVRHSVKSASVDVAALTAFQHVLNMPVRDELPSGYVHAFAFPVAMSVMAREDFPLPLLGMVHLRNRVEHFARIDFRESLDITAWAENLSGHRAGTQVDLMVEVSSGGKTRWRGNSTYLAKGIFLPGTDKVNAREKEEFQPPAPTARWRLGAGTGRDYAQVSGDFNPIHLSALSAKILGMRQQIAHGMYMASRVVQEATPPGAKAFTWEISFEAPVYLPATLGVAIDEAMEENQWEGTTFSAWNEKSWRRHFHGSIRPIS